MSDLEDDAVIRNLKSLDALDRLKAKTLEAGSERRLPFLLLDPEFTRAM